MGRQIMYNISLLCYILQVPQLFQPQKGIVNMGLSIASPIILMKPLRGQGK